MAWGLPGLLELRLVGTANCRAASQQDMVERLACRLQAFLLAAGGCVGDGYGRRYRAKGTEGQVAAEA